MIAPQEGNSALNHLKMQIEVQCPEKQFEVESRSGMTKFDRECRSGKMKSQKVRLTFGSKETCQKMMKPDRESRDRESRSDIIKLD